jgi:hypothetical protein
VSNVKRGEREGWRRGDDVALRFGGSLTGVGTAAGALHLFGADRTLSGSVSVSMLILGIALLVLGYHARPKYRS